MMTELLCPAGGMPQLRAAVRYGADAVYGGAQQFGLRAFAGNFSMEELAQAVSLCHENGKKFYITLNILPFDDDMDGLLQTARDALDRGVDGAIVSDLGAICLLREKLPQLPIHVSTQANVMNSYSAKEFIRLGASRIVLAREMNLDRIRRLHRELGDETELEAFVHGAMCMSFSGRCMLSDHLTGRGGNKGACAQPCRWEYALMEKKRPGEYMPVEQDERGTYLLSAYDLCMIEHLPEMLDAGITSLKIEGRMKTAYYVATVTYAYRAALDALKKGEAEYRHVLPSLIAELKKASHRDWNTGFFFGAPEPASGAGGFKQDMEFCADVAGCENGLTKLILKNRFYMGDTLEALTPAGPVSVPVTDIITENGEHVKTVSVAGQTVYIPVNGLSEGDILRGPNRNHRVQG